MDQAQIDQFLQNGRSAITAFETGRQALEIYAESFEARGGAAVFGDDALQIVTFYNALAAFMTPEFEVIVAKYRQDI